MNFDEISAHVLDFSAHARILGDEESESGMPNPLTLFHRPRCGAEAAREAHNLEVAGSIPVAPTLLCDRNALRLAATRPDGCLITRRSGDGERPRPRCLRFVPATLAHGLIRGRRCRPGTVTRRILSSLNTPLFDRPRLTAKGATIGIPIDIILAVHRHGQGRVAEGHHAADQTPHLALLPLDDSVEVQPHPDS